VSEAAARSAAAVSSLDAITRRLRRECPWDREQDERSIVPHTVEEAYELADAAGRGDDARMLDELGDVLFQVHFLALLLEERGAGDLAAVADHCREKLIRRHPHVFGETSEQTGAEQGGHHRDTPGREAEDVSRSDSLSAAQVLRNWDRIKREEEGRGGELFADVPENLPALLYARKLQRRAASGGGEESDPAAAARALREAADDLAGLLEQGEIAAPGAGEAERRRVEAAIGDLLFAAVDVARRMRADPELALRAAADRFRELKDSGSA
jgi:nucleoside triphosphate diphosphatase